MLNGVCVYRGGEGEGDKEADQVKNFFSIWLWLLPLPAYLCDDPAPIFCMDAIGTGSKEQSPQWGHSEQAILDRNVNFLTLLEN